MNSSNVLNASIKSINSLAGFGYAMIPVAITGTLGSVFSTVYILHKLLFTRKKLLLNLRSYDLMFCNMSLASLFFSAFYLPVAAFSTIVGPQSIIASREYHSFCVFTAFSYFSLTTTCAFTHSAIAANRLFVVVFPHQRNLQSPVCAAMLILISWIIPAVTFIFPFFKVFGEYGFAPSSRCGFVNVNYTYQAIYKAISGFVPLAIMVICYGLVAYFEISSRKRLAPGNNKRKSVGSGRDVRLRREARATRTALLTCAAFALGYLPNAIVGVAASIKMIQSSNGQLASLWMWIGCSINPGIYIFLNSELRRKILSVFGWKSQTVSSSQEQDGSILARSSMRRVTFPHVSAVSSKEVER
ncbi:red-sensitive opsin-like [Paramacrobiotus metropolitanus]|uniref:red-sensitive opsin-like n=1 Tax=Paramacrobiotus metropolitanus TaxID=2943436 RepID=UPI002446541D|nr:red-sensitive opsin-like [Paramacrobiotus metropolitanus]